MTVLPAGDHPLWTTEARPADTAADPGLTMAPVISPAELHRAGARRRSPPAFQDLGRILEYVPREP
jgi:hypothetical protein